MRRLALLTLLLVGCKSKLDLDSPRPWKCSTRGAQECSKGWVCNLAVGFCIDADAGVPLACGLDEDCGRWRCSPNHVCVDRSVEGRLTTLPPLEPLALVSPLVPGGAMHISQPALIPVPGGYSIGTSVLFDGPEGLWLQSEDFVSSEGVRTGWRTRRVSTAGPSIVTTQGPDSFVHALWTLVDGGLSIRFESSDAGIEVPGQVSRLTPLRSTGVSEPGDLRGAAVIATPWGSVLTRLGEPDASVFVPSATTDVAWLSSRQCGPALFTLADGSVTMAGADAGIRETDVQDLRVEGTWLGWRAHRSIWWQDRCTTDAPLVVQACPQPDGGSGSLAAWSLFTERNGAVLPLRVCNEDQRQLVHVGFDPPYPLYDDLEFASSGDATWARSARSGLLKRFAGGVAVDLSLPRGPEALFRYNGTVMAARVDRLFSQTPAGFLATMSFEAQESALAASDGRYIVLRGGVVLASTWVAAFAATTWPFPRGPVLLRTVPLPDAGTLLAVAHDDVIDVAQLNQSARSPAELTPTVAPSPGITVRDLALAPVRDGGLATGYAIAGGALVALTASTPTRWTTTRVSLPMDVLHVWFDTDGPRAVTVDGTVLGLTALVALSPPTPAPAVAATSVCGSPMVLTDEALYQLTDAGWRAVPGTSGVSFTGGSVFELDGGVYVFDSSGRSWTQRACP